MTLAPRPSTLPKFRALLTQLLLILGGILFALVIATALLSAFAGDIFNGTSYYERRSANQTLLVEWKPLDGDLFVALPNSIKPPAENSILESFTIRWDADGFRLPAQTAESYPIAVFGDSFTEGFNVSRPYPDVMAEALGIGVQNYGYRAYGPTEIAQAAQAVVDREPRQWLIYGYFSGNDLGDAVRPPKIDTRNPFALWGMLFQRIQARTTTQPTVVADVHYDFPMPVIIGGNYYEMAFLWYYWWWLLPPDQGFAASRNFAVLSESLDTIAATEAEACKALVYIPTKEQLYYRYIYETERRWVRENGQRLVLDAENTIQIVPAPIAEADETQFMADLYAQRDAVQALITTKSAWQFIDLTPTFEQAVATGELLYYPYDSHWNQAGHTLAGKAVAEYLAQQPLCQP